jgi:hypothetical protein
MCSLRLDAAKSRWPFWLLLAAWLCASYPLAATYVVVWLGEARTFSHQQRLTADVARLLVGEETPSLLVDVENEGPAKKPAVPPTSSSKKVELAFEESAQVIEFVEPMQAHFAMLLTWESALSAAPPHGPPRGAGLS